MACSICGASEELDLHVLFQCPFAERMGEASGVDTLFWAHPFQSIAWNLSLLIWAIMISLSLLRWRLSVGMLAIRLFFNPRRPAQLSYAGVLGMLYAAFRR